MSPVERRLHRGRVVLAFVALAGVSVALVRGDAVRPVPSAFVSLKGGDISLPAPPWGRGRIQALIREAASEYGVDPALVRAVVWVESGYDPYAVSPRGARGLMQLTEDTARELGVSNPFDPRQNVFGGVKYLSRMLKLHDGDVALALASYNAGPEAVRRFGGVPPFEQTQGYLVKIRRRFRGLPEPAPLAPPQAEVLPAVMD
jgi:soluble lytic murein transglycosylase-like protein